MYFVSSFLMMYFLLLFIFFFKQKTAYEMRISDWSSDVCSSDLIIAAAKAGPDAILLPKVESAVQVQQVEALLKANDAPKTAIWCMMETPKGILQAQIGRASCRERVCQYV